MCRTSVRFTFPVPRCVTTDVEDHAAADRAPEDAVAASSLPGSGLHSDVSHSLANALKLGSSLLGTWAVALVIRMLLPRFLGPAAFGALQFADAFSIIAMVTTWLGVEMYIRKEIPVRPQHASDFLGGTMLTGAGIGVVVLALVLPALSAGGKSPDVLLLVAILCGAQLLANQSNTLAAVLHSTSKVDGLAALNIGAKLAWGGGIAMSFWLGFGVRGVAVSMLASELLRFLCLLQMTRAQTGLVLRVDRAATQSALVASAPYYVLGVAQTIYARVDVSILSFLANDTEVGWYGAASTIAGMSMLLSPLIAWVILPLLQRAAARSPEELATVSRRGLELVLVVAFPVTLAFFVSAPIIVPLAFGAAYEVASHALRILAPTFVLTYAAIVCGLLLVRMDRGWAATGISIASMILAPILNLLIVPVFQRAFGPGGAGMGAATCLSLTELFAAAALMIAVGGDIIDRRTITVIGKTLAISLAVVALDYALLPIGAWRLPIDGLAYLAAGILTGAIDRHGLTLLARNALAERKAQKAGTVA